MAVLHDMAEAITGDIVTVGAEADSVSVEEKGRLEADAMATLTAALGGFSPAGAAAVNALVRVSAHDTLLLCALAASAAGSP